MVADMEVDRVADTSETIVTWIQKKSKELMKHVFINDHQNHTDVLMGYGAAQSNHDSKLVSLVWFSSDYY